MSTSENTSLRALKESTPLYSAHSHELSKIIGDAVGPRVEQALSEVQTNRWSLKRIFHRVTLGIFTKHN